MTGEKMEKIYKRRSAALEKAKELDLRVYRKDIIDHDKKGRLYLRTVYYLR